jgi:signal peptide peptidase SppA
VSLSDAPDADRANAFEARRRESNARVGSIGGAGIAVIPVVGTISQRAGMMTEWCGGTSTQQISAALADALRDDAVGQILMEFDTPGGSVFGVSELGDEIHEAAKSKPVIGVANSLSASAGYWLMSQCSQAYVTPGGEVGSIGVWMAHEDWSKAMSDSGVVTTMVSAGKFKVEGNPYEPLGEDARAFMQSRVDDYYGAFVRAVARGRGVGVQQVRDGMGQGRVLGADEALAQGMVDGVATLSDVVRRMQKDARAAKAERPARSHRSALAAARLDLAML